MGWYLLTRSLSSYNGGSGSGKMIRIRIRNTYCVLCSYIWNILALKIIMSIANKSPETRVSGDLFTMLTRLSTASNRDPYIDESPTHLKKCSRWFSNFTFLVLILRDAISSAKTPAWAAAAHVCWDLNQETLVNQLIKHKQET